MKSIQVNQFIVYLSLVIGGLGLIISWIAFTNYILEYGPDLLGFWNTALTSTGQSGLTYDLIACGAILTFWTLASCDELGWRKVIAICLMTWILGVCGGLALWTLWYHPSKIINKTRHG